MAEIINWDDIRTEYVSSDVSLRCLARKYGVAPSTITKKCKKEGWKSEKESIVSRSNQNVIEQTIDTRKSIAEKCIRILEKMVDKVEESVDIVEADDFYGMKQIVSMLKDLKDMGAFELKEETEDNTLIVRFESDDYGE